MPTRYYVNHLIGGAALALLSAFCLNTQAAGEGEANVPLVAPGETVPLTLIPNGVFLRVPNDPQDMIWERVPEYQIQLTPAAPVHPSIALRHDLAATPLALYFSVVSDRERLYVKLRWTDASQDVTTKTHRFRDGAAVQFALAGGEATSYIMGSAEMPVNIWYWQSDNNSAQNLGAGGYGSTTRLPQQSVSASGHFGPARLAQDSQWTVVMSRPLAVTPEIERESDYTVAFDAGSPQPLAFAVWQGDDTERQRDGNKRVSQGWVTLDLSALASTSSEN